MALSADAIRNFLNAPTDIVQLGVKASTTLYRGAFCEAASGVIRGCTASSGNAFAGIALRAADNSGGSDGTIVVSLVRRGILKSMAVTGASAVTDAGSTVYASADDTLTLTSTNNISIGKVIRWVSSTLCDVEFEAAPARSI